MQNKDKQLDQWFDEVGQTRREFPFVNGRFIDFFCDDKPGSNIVTIREIILCSKVGEIHSVHMQYRKLELQP